MHCRWWSLDSLPRAVSKITDSYWAAQEGQEETWLFWGLPGGGERLGLRLCLAFSWECAAAHSCLASNLKSAWRLCTELFLYRGTSPRPPRPGRWHGRWACHMGVEEVPWSALECGLRAPPQP